MANNAGTKIMIKNLKNWLEERVEFSEFQVYWLDNELVNFPERKLELFKIKFPSCILFFINVLIRQRSFNLFWKIVRLHVTWAEVSNIVVLII